MICICTLSRTLGVSRSRKARASPLREREYFSTVSIASSQVVRSAATGPEAIISGGSPSTSERITASTRAGAHHRANRPPLTPESRLRMVLISRISAPQAKSCDVIFCSCSGGIKGFSNRALPPPESRNRTVSLSDRSSVMFRIFSVPRKLFSSGTGWPASRQDIPSRGCFTWPYLVSTMPVSIFPGSCSRAAFAICHAAFPTETRMTRPENVTLSSARRTASSGRTEAMAPRTIFSASARNAQFIQIPPLFFFPIIARREEKGKGNL